MRFIISGSNFSPKKVEERTNIILSAKEEVGEIIKRGPLKGTRTTIGYGRFELPKDMVDANGLYSPPVQYNGKSIDPLTWIVDVLYSQIDTIYECGAEEVNLDYYIYGKGDKSLSFEPEILKKIGEMNVALLISCYEDYVD